MKKNLKKSLVKKSVLPAAFAVLGSAIALTSVSYAWFTIGDSGKIDQIDVNVAAADGLQFHTGSYDGEWGSLLLGSDLASAKNQAQDGQSFNQMPSKALLPVSTNAEHTKGNITLYKGEITNAAGTGKQQITTTADSENFFRFDFYVEVNSKQDLFLAPGSTVAAKADPTKTGTGIENAVRVAFINMGYGAKLSEAKNAAPAAGTPEAIVWEPNAGVHTPAAQNWADDNGVNINKVTKPIILPTGVDGPQPLADFDNTKYCGDLTTKQAPLDGDGLKITTLEQGVTRMRVYIWVEGQDVDCINAASDATFTTTLNFKRKDYVAG